MRDYPAGSLFGNPVGYSFIQAGQTGLERSENDALVGNQNEFSSIIDQLRGLTQQGANVTLTIDANVQRLATDSLNSAIASTPGASGFGGSAVALDPTTGAIKAMVSVPGLRPEQGEDVGGASRAEQRQGPVRDRQPRDPGALTRPARR